MSHFGAFWATGFRETKKRSARYAGKFMTAVAAHVSINCLNCTHGFMTLENMNVDWF